MIDDAIQTSYLEFRETLARHVRELEACYPERHSTDWYCLRYLKRVHKSAMRFSSPRQVSGSVRGLIRFYVDAVDPDSGLASRCEAVIRAHREALRLERRD